MVAPLGTPCWGLQNLANVQRKGVEGSLLVLVNGVARVLDRTTQGALEQLCEEVPNGERRITLAPRRSRGER